MTNQWSTKWLEWKFNSTTQQWLCQNMSLSQSKIFNKYCNIWNFLVKFNNSHAFPDKNLQSLQTLAENDLFSVLSTFQKCYTINDSFNTELKHDLNMLITTKTLQGILFDCYILAYSGGTIIDETISSCQSSNTSSDDDYDSNIEDIHTKAAFQQTLFITIEFKKYLEFYLNPNNNYTSQQNTTNQLHTDIDHFANLTLLFIKHWLGLIKIIDEAETMIESSLQQLQDTAEKTIGIINIIKAAAANTHQEEK
jgi:hypothetical protein